MKIDELMGDVISRYTKQSKVLDKTSLKKPANDKKQDISTSKAAEDKVEISANAKMLMQLQDDDANRLEKLNSIKLAINNGTYRPNIEETAKAILKEWMGE